MFPADGRCKTFCERADGFERGEGGAAVCQRPLDEALAANDVVLCVVRGSTTIHKGGGASLRAMRGPAIQHKVRMALLDAGLAPGDMRLIEASGLGEPYGDAVEVGAYRNVFQPGRERSNPLIFNSVHTNVCHMDGASGLASFTKLVLLSNQHTAPPIVHFRALNPLVTGQKSGTQAAQQMGHTYDSDVNVRDFPALFPKEQVPVPSRGSRLSAPSGVSAFGFGGTMAHVIVDVMAVATTDRVRPPLRYSRAVRFPWKVEAQVSNHVQNFGEMALEYLEAVIRNALQDVLPMGPMGGALDLPRGANLFKAGLTEATAKQLLQELVEQFGTQGTRLLTLEALRAGPTISQLADKVLQGTFMARARDTFDAAMLFRSFLDLQNRRQVLDPARAIEQRPAKNPGRMVFVLAGPRSGSSLTQLVLNKHPGLFAPQELYLLHFFSMEERAKRLQGAELSNWIFVGLRKAVMELRGCSLDEADAILEEFSRLSTQDVYRVLQSWAAPRMLVDKTPPYVWSLDTLRRAEALFEEPLYIHVHRHPYANIQSCAEQAISRDFLERHLGSDIFDGNLSEKLDDALWSESEALWAKGNANVMDFFREVPAERRIRLPYEDLLRDPEGSVRRLCDFLGLPYDASMCDPYTKENVASFQPVEPGGRGSTDPKLLTHKGIDARMADAWMKVPVSRPLSRFAAHVAAELGYELPMWKEPELRGSAPAELVRLNAATVGAPLVLVHDVAGTVTHLRGLAEALECPVFGLQMSQAALQCASIGSMDALAAHYLKVLECLSLPPSGFLLGGSGFGARVAHAMAVAQNAAVAAAEAAQAQAQAAAAAAAAAVAAAMAAGGSGAAPSPPAPTPSRLSKLAMRISPRKPTPPQGAAQQAWDSAAGAGGGSATPRRTTPQSPSQQQPAQPPLAAPGGSAAAAGAKPPPPVVALLLLDAPLGRPVDPPLGPGVYGLYCAAWEARARWPGAPGPELSVASFRAGIAAAASPDAQLDYTAQFRPEEMAQADWDRVVDKILNSVHVCSLLAAKPRALQPSAAAPGLYAGPCVLLFSDLGSRKGVAAAVKRVCPAVDAEHLEGTSDLLDPEVLPATVAALCRHVPRIKAAGAAEAEAARKKNAAEGAAAGGTGGEHAGAAPSSSAAAAGGSSSSKPTTDAAEKKKAVVPGGRREG